MIARQRAQHVKVLATKPDDLTLNPRTGMQRHVNSEFEASSLVYIEF